MELLTAALAAADRGWRVFPLRPDDKRPAIRDWEPRATLDPSRIQRCWTTGPYGVGIACGPSRLVVLDLDTPKPDQTPPPAWAREGIHNGADVLAALAEQHQQPLPVDTYTVTTGRGGTHLYYQHPAGQQLRNTARQLGWLVDTRAHGGYVVAAGSTVAGRPYLETWLSDPAPLPAWLAELLTPAPPPPVRPVVVDLPTNRRGAYLATAIARQVDHVTTAPEGQRNQALYRSAVALGQLVAGGELTQPDVTAALTGAGQAAGLGARETARTIASGLRAGHHRPRSVAA
ncbi:bifunctional DNA primase/polymerase [Natronosporangium hydrolyticum]|nr:bifunctional DNA primase/polymerase [Natronosporangium hydrolyticum]